MIDNATNYSCDESLLSEFIWCFNTNNDVPNEIKLNSVKKRNRTNNLIMHNLEYIMLCSEKSWNTLTIFRPKCTRWQITHQRSKVASWKLLCKQTYESFACCRHANDLIKSFHAKCGILKFIKCNGMTMRVQFLLSLFAKKTSKFVW